MKTILITFIYISISLSFWSQEVKLGLPKGHDNWFGTAIKFSANEKYIATADHDVILIWELESSKVIHSLSADYSQIKSIKFSNKGNQIAAAFEYGHIVIWEVETGKQLHDFDSEFSSFDSDYFEFSNDDKTLISSGDKDEIFIWDLTSGELKTKFRHGLNYTYICGLTPNNSKVYSYSSSSYPSEHKEIKFWDLETKDHISTISFELGTISDYPIFTKDGQTILTLTKTEDNNYYIGHYDINTGKKIQETTLTSYSYYGNVYWQYSEQSNMVVINSSSKYVYYDVSSNSVVKIVPHGELELKRSTWNVNSNTNQVIVTSESQMNIIDISTQAIKKTLDFDENLEFIKSMSSSSSGKYIGVITSENNINLVNTITGDQSKLKGHMTPMHLEGMNISETTILMNHYEDSKYSNFSLNIDNGTIVHQGTSTAYGSQIVKAIPNSDLLAIQNEENKIITIYNTTSKTTSDTIPFYGDNFYPLSKDRILFSKEKSFLEIAFYLYDISKNKMIDSLLNNKYSFVAGDSTCFILDDPWDVTTVFNSNDGRSVYSKKYKDNYMSDGMFSKEGNYFVFWSKKDIHVINTKSLKGRRIVIPKDKSIISITINDKKGLLAFQARDKILTYDLQTGIKIFDQTVYEWSKVKQLIFAYDGKTIIIMREYGLQYNYYTLASGEIENFKTHETWTLDHLTDPTYLPKKNLLCSHGYESSIIDYYQPGNGSLVRSHVGHENKITSKLFSKDETQLISSSKDGSIILWDVDSGDEIIRVYIFDDDPNKWVHLHPSGLFDASQEAMKMMYWTKGKEVIEFNQLKDRYWLPGLWKKVLSGEPLPDVRAIGQIKLQPNVDIGEVKDGKLPIVLTKRDGGYGKVSIFINGKEVVSDARGNDMDTSKMKQTINYTIKDHPYLVDGNNTISVIASSADGFVQGRGTGFEMFIQKSETKTPHFFGIVIGIGEYANEKINLKYPVKDANAIAQSIEMGAENLFGVERTHLYNITSSSNISPTKTNIRSIFEEISKQAKAEDILVVYLSGHGISWGGEQGDFYFLTADATASSKSAYSDPKVRSSKTISTAEWVDWIKTIPALKQVMIIDACGSGKAVDNLLTARDIEGSQIKAIDRMKDRTGMYIISGCTADAVSYEASQYGQGLLTYSILQAMKGAALKENKYIDVFTIFDHARETVPSLAKHVGGIQEPQLLIPKGGSFDIGMLEDDDKKAIPLSEPKRIFIRSMLMDKTKFRDVLNISNLLNDELGMLSSKGDGSKLVFFDANEYGNSCQITGGYSGTENNLELSMTIICGEEEISYNLSATSIDELIKKIIVLVNE